MSRNKKSYNWHCNCHGHRSKAQSGVEYIVLVAFLLAVIAPIFLFAMDSSTRSVRTTRSREVVEKIAIAADNLCAIGGGKTSVNVFIPYGVEYYVISERTVKMGLSMGNSTGEVFATTLCNVTGNITTKEGYALVPVSMLTNGTVLIGGS